MNDPQIEALAREYVKDVYSGDADFIDEAEQVLAWLSTRYCLVEKCKLRKAYKNAQKKQYNKEGDYALFLIGRNCSAMLVDLFPSIAKEMEE